MPSGEWKIKKGKFLFSVRALSIVFKNKFCDGLKMLHNAGRLNYNKPQSEKKFAQFIVVLHQKQWVVNSKPGFWIYHFKMCQSYRSKLCFAGKSSVLEYLGRYTHKIAISNYRLIRLEKGMFTFSYRDRKAGDVKKVMSLPVDEFIQRFSWYILPKGFIKTRHYGLFSTRTKQVKLALVRKALFLLSGIVIHSALKSFEFFSSFPKSF